MYSASEIARIRSDRSILEFLSHPQRAGRYLRALCPLPRHSERTASFYLYPDGSYYCFGCGRGGPDVIAFAIHYWDLVWPRDVPLVLERLGARRGGGTAEHALPVPRAPMRIRSPVAPLLPDPADLVIYRAAAALYHATLWTPAGRPARAYLYHRGLSDALIRQEGLGLSCGTLARHLQHHGLSPARAQACGLLSAGGQDTFAGRIVWWEWRHVAGLWTPVWATARLVGDPLPAHGHCAPKYLNTRGHRLLGGLDHALDAPAVAVVEGPFDRLAIQSFGDQAVCLGSHTPPEAVLNELRRLAQTAVLYLVPDQDRPGRRGVWSLIYRLRLPPTARLVLVDLPMGIKDPGALASHPTGSLLYHQAKRGGRRIDMARVRRLCDCCHALVRQRRQADRPMPAR